MKINIRNLDSEVHESSVVWNSVENSDVFEDLRLDGALRCNYRIVPEKVGKYWLEANVSGSQLLTCSRTLEDFSRSFDVSFQVSVLLDARCVEQELDDSDEEIYELKIPMNARDLDLVACVRQEVLLDEPPYPVAPGAKIDERYGKTEFGEKEPDPRWAALRALSEKK